MQRRLIVVVANIDLGTANHQGTNRQDRVTVDRSMQRREAILANNVRVATLADQVAHKVRVVRLRSSHLRVSASTSRGGSSRASSYYRHHVQGRFVVASTLNVDRRSSNQQLARKLNILGPCSTSTTIS